MTYMKLKIFLASDHAGLEMKEYVKKYLQKNGHEVEDCGAYKYDSEDDYPEFMIRAAKKVASSKGSKGIIFGGSGQGEAIVANKSKGIRAAVYNCNNPEIVNLSRAHNDSNVLSIGARFITKKHASEAVKLWLATDFSGEPRHKRRLKQIEGLEKKLCK